MEGRSETASENEMANEAEDLNVSNLLVAKSERAPATEPLPRPKEEKSGTEVLKTTVLGLLGGLGVAAVVILGRWLASRPR